VGEIPVELTIRTEIPWADVPALLLPGLVIALVGFAEPAAIARRYAAADRKPWDSNREFVGQGLANMASGVAGGYPVSGSCSRTVLNRLGGARTRWSGAFTGLTVLAILPFASVLEPLPVAVLAGLVVAAAVWLIDIGALLMYWRWSRPQVVVVVVTVAATLLLAPRVERGLMLGVGSALVVHLWREMKGPCPQSWSPAPCTCGPPGCSTSARLPGWSGR
jgi:SulP family sulfate permease